MPRGVRKNSSKVITNTVQPVESSPTAPVTDNTELQDALHRAQEAETRARIAEEKLKITSNESEIPQDPMDFQTDDGKELCWNCKNHGKRSMLDKGTCFSCGFVKDKLYNGDIEAAKASARMAAGIFN